MSRITFFAGDDDSFRLVTTHDEPTDLPIPPATMLPMSLAIGNVVRALTEAAAAIDTGRCSLSNPDSHVDSESLRRIDAAEQALFACHDALVALNFGLAV